MASGPGRCALGPAALWGTGWCGLRPGRSHPLPLGSEGNLELWPHPTVYSKSICLLPPGRATCPRTAEPEDTGPSGRNMLEQMGAHCSGKGPHPAWPAPGFPSMSVSQICDTQAPVTSCALPSAMHFFVHRAGAANSHHDQNLYSQFMDEAQRGYLSKVTEPKRLSQDVLQDLTPSTKNNHASDAPRPDPRSGNFLSNLSAWRHPSMFSPVPAQQVSCPPDEQPSRRCLAWQCHVTRILTGSPHYCARGLRQQSGKAGCKAVGRWPEWARRAGHWPGEAANSDRAGGEEACVCRAAEKGRRELGMSGPCGPSRPRALPI